MPNSLPQLAVRLPNWLGDVMMALPALNVLQQQGLELHLLGKPWVNDLLQAMPFQTYSLHSSFRENVRTLRGIDAQTLALLPNSLSSALMGFFAGKKMLGYKKNGRQCLLRTALEKPPGRHEVEYFSEILFAAALQVFPELSVELCLSDLAPQFLEISSEVADDVSAKLRAYDISKSFWVLCPAAHGVSEKAIAKVWPHWRELDKVLFSRKITSVVCPGPGEQAYCEQFLPNSICLPDVNLSQYAVVLAQSAQVIANDSGPMHLSAAVGAKTLGLFGATDPQRTRPWGGEFLGARQQWPTLQAVLKAVR